MSKKFKITVDEYLKQKGIPILRTEKGGQQLIIACPFGEHSNDGKGGAKFYINKETSQYHCKKCGEKGNLITLAEYLDGNADAVVAKKKGRPRTNNKPFTPELVEECHNNLPPHIREWLNNERGITDEIIDKYKIGYGNFHNKKWITIPITNNKDEYVYFKLRKDPLDTSKGSKMITYEGGQGEIYGYDTLNQEKGRIVLCEGELDRLALLSRGVPAITTTTGAGTFQEKFVEDFNKEATIYVCFDNDNAGIAGAERTAKILKDGGVKHVFITTLPEIVGDGGDITDYFVKHKGEVVDLFETYASQYPIDIEQFEELTLKDIQEVLDLTIKYDNHNKLTVFLGLISTYTADNQFNLALMGPSSTGKTHIILEVARLFPREDLIKLANCSPTAFFHEAEGSDLVIQEKKRKVINLERKIIIFIDQPNTKTQEMLRPIMSHDEKEYIHKITDRTQQQGLRTKNITIRGYSVFVFASANMNIDEQEMTRHLILSPETTQEKRKASIDLSIQKQADPLKFERGLEENPQRKLLQERIRAIKQANISHIIIPNEETVKKLFYKKYNKNLQDRHMRDVSRIISIIKSFTVLNWTKREQIETKEGLQLIATEEDIKNGFELYSKIAKPQEFGITQYALRFHEEIIIPCYKKKNKTVIDGIETVVGITRKEVSEYHLSTYGKPLNIDYFRKNLLPALASAGLLYEEKEGRNNVIFPISRSENEEEKTSNNTIPTIYLKDLSPEDFPPDLPYQDEADKAMIQYVQSLIAE